MRTTVAPSSSGAGRAMNDSGGCSNRASGKATAPMPAPASTIALNSLVAIPLMPPPFRADNLGTGYRQAEGKLKGG